MGIIAENLSEIASFFIGNKLSTQTASSEKK